MMEVKRVLKTSGSCWVNLGDTYNGNKKGKTDNKVSNYLKDSSNGINKTKGDLPDKCLLQIPSRFAIEMTNRGWVLRNEIIWYKPNCMPSSAKDRFTVDFEKLFFFVKSKKYYFDQQKVPNKEISIKARNSKLNQTTDKGAYNSAINVHLGEEKRGFRFIPEDGRNIRCVWTITTKPFKGSHFATFPPDLIDIPIKSCCPANGIVLDPFMGSGTTGVVAKQLKRFYVGIELNPKYVEMAEKRIKNTLVQEQLF
jgi:site-specific DNA-methyltransferase (adenine-specific)